VLAPARMPKESLAAKTARAVEILEALDRVMPEAHIELDYRTPLELVAAVVLSAQCTDRRVNMVTPELFKAFPSAAHYARSTPAEVEPFIKSLGLFRNKAKSLVALGQALLDSHGGEVPTARAALEKLPGVGKKTAGVVTIHLNGDPAFPVDTHVQRLAGRMGLAKGKTPDQVEAGLQQVVPQAWWTKGHQLLVWHGRRVCHARKPECHRCVVATRCPKLEVRETPKRPTRASKASRTPRRGRP